MWLKGIESEDRADDVLGCKRDAIRASRVKWLSILSLSNLISGSERCEYKRDDGAQGWLEITQDITVEHSLNTR